MTSILTAYSSSTSTSITASIASLAANSILVLTGWQSAIIDNSSTSYLDSLVAVMTKGTTNSLGTLDVFVSAAIESVGAVFTDGAGTGDGAFALSATNLGLSPLNSILLCQVQLNGTASVTSSPVSVADKFGGTLPPQWCLIFVNNSGGALDSTAGSHVCTTTGITGLIQ